MDSKNSPKKLRDSVLEAEKATVVYLKKIVARLQRKSDHGCSDASCPLCDPEQKGDGTWELT